MIIVDGSLDMNIFQRIHRWRYDKKNPCLKCLVSAACETKTSILPKCEIISNYIEIYHEKEMKAIRLDGRLDDIFMMCIGSFCILTCAFGLWKWIELAIKAYRELLLK